MIYIDTLSISLSLTITIPSPVWCQTISGFKSLCVVVLCVYVGLSFRVLTLFARLSWGTIRKYIYDFIALDLCYVARRQQFQYGLNKLSGCTV